MQFLIGKKSICDSMICPHCRDDHCILEETNEVIFNGVGEGHYDARCYCIACGRKFRLHMDFNYRVTNSYTR